MTEQDAYRINMEFDPTREGLSPCPLERLHMEPRPWEQTFKLEEAGLVKPDNKSLGRVGLGRNSEPVVGQEGVGGGESRPLVAIDKRYVLGQAFPQRGGFIEEIGVISSPRTIKGEFQ